MTTLVTRCNFILTAAVQKNIHDMLSPLGVNSCYQIRWRKRRWAPKNASKIFYVPEKPPMDLEKDREYRTRKHHYDTHLRAIRSVFLAELLESKAEAEDESLKVKIVEEWEALLEKNHLWNERTAFIREAHQKQEADAHEEQQLQQAIKEDEERQQQLEQAIRLVQKEKEEATQFVDMDNLDAEIEKALNKRHSYNFCLDRDGNIHVEQPDGKTVMQIVDSSIHTHPSLTVDTSAEDKLAEIHQNTT